MVNKVPSSSSHFDDIVYNEVRAYRVCQPNICVFALQVGLQSRLLHIGVVSGANVKHVRNNRGLTFGYVALLPATISYPSIGSIGLWP